MPFFKKTGINSFDSPYGQNIGTMATTTNNGYTTPEFKRKASFKLTENNRQRTNVVRSERRRQSPLVSQTTKRQGSRKRILKQKKKKWGVFKRLFARKKTMKNNYDDDNDHTVTVVSPSPSSPDSLTAGFFTTPTQGFECILDSTMLSKQFNAKNPSTPIAKSGIQSVRVATAQTQPVKGQRCANISPFDNWEDFVSLLTSTNETLKTSFNAANESIMQFLYSDTPADSPKEKKSGIPVNEVKVSLQFSESLPFDEATDGSIMNNNGTIVSNNGTVVSNNGTIVSNGSVKANNNFSNRNVVAKERSVVIEEDNLGQEENVIVDYVDAPVAMPFEVPDPNIPLEEVYDSAFTLSFLRDVSTVGILLTYFKVPNGENVNNEISSSLVNMTIKPGLSRGSRLLEPKLFWKELQRPSGLNSSYLEEHSISLLGIHSIHTSLNPGDDDQTQFFTITTEQGEVHAFEAPTILERHNFVYGIQNVVAWLSYHLVMGNMASGTELVSNLDEEQGEQSGELPSLKTPAQAMNVLSHAFLD